MSYNDHKVYTNQEYKNQYKWTNQNTDHQSGSKAHPPGNSHTHHKAVSGQDTFEKEKKGTKRPHSPENGVPESVTDSGKKKMKSLNAE